MKDIQTSRGDETLLKVVTLHDIFKQNAMCLAKRLNTIVSTNIDEPILYIVLGAHQNPLLLLELQKKYKCQYLILNSEHYSSDVLRNKYYLKLLKENYVADYLPSNIKQLKLKHDINVLTYFWFEFPQQNQSMMRPIDILFIGQKNSNRLKVEEQMKTKYSRLNVQFIYPDKYTDITPILLNAKSVLNIPFYDDNVEMHRINHALACGCNVISHSLGNLNELYKHFIYIADDYEPQDIEPRQPYEVLVENQLNNIQTHFNWTVNQIRTDARV